MNPLATNVFDDNKQHILGVAAMDLGQLDALPPEVSVRGRLRREHWEEQGRLRRMRDFRSSGREVFGHVAIRAGRAWSERDFWHHVFLRLFHAASARRATDLGAGAAMGGSEDKY